MLVQPRSPRTAFSHKDGWLACVPIRPVHREDVVPLDEIEVSQPADGTYLEKVNLTFNQYAVVDVNADDLAKHDGIRVLWIVGEYVERMRVPAFEMNG